MGEYNGCSVPQYTAYPLLQVLHVTGKIYIRFMYSDRYEMLESKNLRYIIIFFIHGDKYPFYLCRTK